MSLEKLTQEGFIEEFNDVSSGPHPSKFCFVLGAGASKTSGIKTGQELVDIWEKQLFERNGENHTIWKKNLGITEQNKYSFYSQYYEERYKKRPKDGLNFLEKMMEHVNPNVGYVVLAHLLTETAHNVVITTNFDHLIEDAVNHYEKSIPLVIGHESLAHYITEQITRPTIVKIHRDLLFDPKNKAADVEKLHDSWKKPLDIIFSEYHPVFIGYAGNDNSLMDYLIENREKFSDGKWKFPYWTLYKTDRIPEGKVKEFLEGSGGYYINFDGFDELLCLIGAKTRYKMPTKEKFLEETKSRYEKLYDAFENIISADDKKGSRGYIMDENSGSSLEKLGEAVQKITSESGEKDMYFEAVRLHNRAIYERALELKRILVKQEQGNARYHDSLGVTLHEMGRYAEAEEEKRKAVELEPENARYHDSLGVTLHEMKRYAKAEGEERKAVELEPENARYHASLGVTLHEMKRYTEAEEEKRKAAELEPEDAGYHNSLGVTLHKMKRYTEAEREKRKAVELEPENARYHASLGVTLHEMKRYAEAEEEERKAVGLEPEDARYHAGLGVILHEMKRYAEAEEEERKAVELEPENARYHNSLGVTLHKIGRYTEAEEEKRKAVELEPGNAVYHDNLSATLNEMKRYTEAEEEARNAVELEPENAGYHNNLGVTLHKIGRYTEAEEEKRKAVELEPGNAVYHGNLSATLYEMKRYAEAEEEARKTVELEPENAKYHNSLGVTLYYMERYAEAEEEFRKAVELEPENAEYKNNLLEIAKN